MPRSARLPLVASLLLVVAGLAVLPGVWATITIRQAFFDTLGMGSVYHRHVATERNLFLGTVVVLVVLGIPLLIAALRVAAVPDRDGSRLPFVRRAVWSIWTVLAAVSALDVRDDDAREGRRVPGGHERRLRSAAPTRATTSRTSSSSCRCR